MELRHLKYFQVLAEELHFNRAARRLFITQPPLSRQIRDLEEDLGVELFRRTNRRVELTEYGEYLKVETSQLFRHVNHIRDHISRLKRGDAGQIRIAYVGAAMHSVLPEVLSAMRRHHPGIHIIMSESDNPEQIDALRSGRIDLGFLRMPAPAEGIESRRIYRETLSLVLPPAHSPNEDTPPDLKSLADEPFISFGRSCAPALFDMIIGLCRRHGFSPRIVHQTTQFNSILRMVESGLGYSIVPSSVRSAYDLKVRFVELTEEPERAELSLVFNPGHLTSATALLVDLIGKLELGCDPI